MNVIRAHRPSLPASACTLQSKRSSVTLLNDYIVLGSLGKGAYGSVKLCYSMQDDSLYALKASACCCTELLAGALMDTLGCPGLFTSRLC